MAMRRRTASCVTVIVVLLACAWPTASHASEFTAVWSGVVPSAQPNEIPPASPFYDCPTWGGGGLICDFIWDEGLELRREGFPIYGDSTPPFYDGFGNNTGIGSGDVTINAVCLPGVAPCFDTFTPIRMDMSAFDFRGASGVYFTSSRGGLIMLPDANAVGTVEFSGDLWTNVTSIGIGLFTPDECLPDCEVEREKGMYFQSLTFEATPVAEPATLALLGAAALGVLVRTRRRPPARRV